MASNSSPYLTPAGTQDTTFSGDGWATTSIDLGEFCYDIAVQPDGTILMFGDSSNGWDFDFALVGYNSNGSLNTAFDTDGKLVTNLGLSHDHGRGMVIQPDGKIVTAGFSSNGLNYDFALVRYNEDGSLDTSFDADGVVISGIGSGSDLGYDVALQSDGKIVVAGSSWNGSNSDFALVRYNSDGSLDTTFDGDGKLTTAIGSSNDYGFSVALQTDGKIIVAGSSWNGSNDDFALARYNSDGSLDTTFDGDGKLTTAIGSADDLGVSVALQTDGKIIVAGYSLIGTDFDFALVRYNSDGSLDTTFDTDGKVITDFGFGDDAGYSVVVQADGKILVTGECWDGTTSDFALARYNSDGSLDTTFSSDGRMNISPFDSVLGPYNDVGQCIALQPDGNIVIGGFYLGGAGPDDGYFAVVRLLGGDLPDQEVGMGEFFGLTVPANLFTDPEGDPLVFSASLFDDSALPAWLSFNPVTRIFSGTPDSGDVGAIDVKVTVSDGEYSASDIFTLNVTGTPANYIPGTSGNDSMDGGMEDDFFDGLAGDDSSSCLEGNDTLAGGEGNDWLHGNMGNDSVLGGDGNDTVMGGKGNDWVSGNGGDDLVRGGENTDSLMGGDGNDTLLAGKGDDVLDGGAGDDRLDSRLGNDTMTGGAGDDVFVFASTLNGATNVDTITDFTSGDDEIRLDPGIFAALAGNVGNHVGLSAYLLYDGGTGLLSYDADGAGSGAAVAFANVGTGLSFGGMDFFISA